MHWVRVDGYALPKRVGGSPALDFCNTWADWADPWRPGSALDRKREWLADYDRFAVWAGYVRLLSGPTVDRLRTQARAEPAAAGAVLGRAHRLRGLLYRLFTEPNRPSQPSQPSQPTYADAFAGFAQTAQTAVRATVLTAAPDGAVARVLPDSIGVALPLLAVARVAEELLATPVGDKIHVCPGAGCGWLFLDYHGRRRWCDMSSCGNRAKVRAHAARRR